MSLFKKNMKELSTFFHVAINGSVHAFDQDLRRFAEHPTFSYHVCYQSPSEEDRKHPYFEKKGSLIYLGYNRLYRIKKQIFISVDRSHL
jgi:ferredoxin-NADP reductase